MCPMKYSDEWLWDGGTHYTYFPLSLMLNSVGSTSPVLVLSMAGHTLLTKDIRDSHNLTIMLFNYILNRTHGKATLKITTKTLSSKENVKMLPTVILPLISDILPEIPSTFLLVCFPVTS